MLSLSITLAIAVVVTVLWANALNSNLEDTEEKDSQIDNDND